MACVGDMGGLSLWKKIKIKNYEVFVQSTEVSYHAGPFQVNNNLKSVIVLGTLINCSNVGLPLRS